MNRKFFPFVVMTAFFATVLTSTDVVGSHAVIVQTPADTLVAPNVFSSNFSGENVFFEVKSKEVSQYLPDSICVKLRENMQGFKDRYHSPSITVVVVYDQDIVFGESLGYIDLEKQIPATIHSYYPIMSITKVFTATMLMQLKEKGIITLDDKVAQYVPEFNDYRGSTSTNEITLFQLATHNTGLPRNPPSDIHFARQVDKWIMSEGNDKSISILSSSTSEEMLKSLTYVENNYPEYQLKRYGDRNYSNLGYSLLGIAMERAAKNDYASYMTQHIFSPLKMAHSGFITDSLEHNNIAKGYWYNPHLDGFIRTPFWKPESMTPAGGIYSTAVDLAKFLNFQFRHESFENNIILSDHSKSMMLAFNIGWKPSYPFVLHEGSMLGYRCTIVFSPDMKIGWTILTNTTDFDFTRINDIFARLIVPFYTAKPVDMNQYIGVYNLRGGYGSITIYQENDSLYSTYLTDVIPKTPLIPSGNNSYIQKAGNIHTIGYDFIINESSKKVILNMGQLMWVKE